MRFCTYIASDKPLSQSACLWPMSRGGEDIYTEKAYTAQIVPDLDDLSGVLSYIQNHMKTAGELKIWHIWQGVETEPMIRIHESQSSVMSVRYQIEQAMNKLTGMGQTADKQIAAHKSRGLRTKTL